MRVPSLWLHGPLSWFLTAQFIANWLSSLVVPVLIIPLHAFFHSLLPQPSFVSLFRLKIFSRAFCHMPPAEWVLLLSSTRLRLAHAFDTVATCSMRVGWVRTHVRAGRPPTCCVVMTHGVVMMTYRKRAGNLARQCALTFTWCTDYWNPRLWCWNVEFQIFFNTIFNNKSNQQLRADL